MEQKSIHHTDMIKNLGIKMMQLSTSLIDSGETRSAGTCFKLLNMLWCWFPGNDFPAARLDLLGLIFVND